MSENTGPIGVIARMHTAEHILTAVMARAYGSPRNVETHLGAKKSKCDFPVGRPLVEADARAIEDAVNAEIVADHPVSVMHITRAQAEGRLDLWKVPDGVDPVRVVRIGGLDETACAGNHVERTSQIGRFVLRTMTMKDDHVVRIRFGLESVDAL
jgi:misacylated tRNA(Ala) deacylase